MNRCQYLFYREGRDSHADRRLLSRWDHAAHGDRPREAARHRGDRAAHHAGRVNRLRGMFHFRHRRRGHPGFRGRPLHIYAGRDLPGDDRRLYRRGAPKAEGGLRRERFPLAWKRSISCGELGMSAVELPRPIRVPVNRVTGILVASASPRRTLHCASVTAWRSSARIWPTSTQARGAELTPHGRRQLNQEIACVRRAPRRIFPADWQFRTADVKGANFNNNGRRGLQIDREEPAPISREMSCISALLSHESERIFPTSGADCLRRHMLGIYRGFIVRAGRA